MGVLFGVPIYRSMTRRLTASPMVLGGLPAFTLTDQRGQPFGSRELAGKVWVADFIFTSCQGGVPAAQRADGARSASARATSARTFTWCRSPSIPSATRRTRLAEYAARYGANPISWSFLTGPGAGDPGDRGRRLQGRRRQGAQPGAAPTAAPGSGRSSTARNWCWSIASSGSAATSRRRPRASTSCWKPSGASPTALDASRPRLLRTSAMLTSVAPSLPLRSVACRLRDRRRVRLPETVERTRAQHRRPRPRRRPPPRPPRRRARPAAERSPAPSS